MSMDFLYGLRHAEDLYFDVATLWESELQDQLDMEDEGGEEIIEKWSVQPPESHIPPAVQIVEDLAEHALDDICSDGLDKWFDEVRDNPDVLKAAEQLRNALADTIKFRMANAKLSEHVLAWDVGGKNVRLDGEPLYKPAA